MSRIASNMSLRITWMRPMTTVAPESRAARPIVRRPLAIVVPVNAVAFWSLNPSRMTTTSYFFAATRAASRSTPRVELLEHRVVVTHSPW